MKRTKVILLGLLFSAYIIFSLISMHESTRVDGNSFIKSIMERKSTTKEYLLAETNAELFNGKMINNVLYKNVVLDSTIVGIVFKKNAYYIKAVVNSDCENNIYTELLCSEEIIKEYNKTKSNSVYLTAKINNIECSRVIAELESLDNNCFSIDLGYSTLLQGECITLQEKPITFYN